MTKIARTLLALMMVASVLFVAPRATKAAEMGEIVGSGTAKCMLPGTSYDGKMAASGKQGEVIELSIDGFADPDVVSIWLTFPDGRVYDVVSAFWLDGLYDFVEDNQTKFLVNGGGSLGYETTEKLPVGCHRVTVQSVFTGNEVIIPFVLQPGGAAPSGPATLKAVPAKAKQNTSITLEGRGFKDGEDVAFWLTQPDGTVVDLGQGSNVPGDFDLVNFFVPSLLPVGMHYITAKGLSSGYTAVTPFELMAGNDDPVNGNVAIAVDYTDNKQRELFGVGGVGFTGNSDMNGEVVSLWVTFPNGKVLFLGDVKTASDGSFVVLFPIDEQFPAGRHSVSARGNESGYVATDSFVLEEGNGPGLVDIVTTKAPATKSSQTAYE